MTNIFNHTRYQVVVSAILFIPGPHSLNMGRQGLYPTVIIYLVQRQRTSWDDPQVSRSLHWKPATRHLPSSPPSFLDAGSEKIDTGVAVAEDGDEEEGATRSLPSGCEPKSLTDSDTASSELVEEFLSKRPVLVRGHKASDSDATAVSDGSQDSKVKTVDDIA